MKSPIKQILEAEDWTITDIAKAADISYTAAYNTVSGKSVEPNPDILDTLKSQGYKPSELTSKYRAFREKQRKEILN